MSTKSGYILNLKNTPIINKQMYKISTIINIEEWMFFIKNKS